MLNIPLRVKNLKKLDRSDSYKIANGINIEINRNKNSETYTWFLAPNYLQIQLT